MKKLVLKKIYYIKMSEFLQITNVKHKNNFCDINNYYNYIKEYLYPQKEQHWIDIDLDQHIFIVNSKDVQIGYNTFNGIIFLCFPYIMMIDFDESPEFTKDNAINLLKNYTSDLEEQLNTKILFYIYESDRGIHAFLVSHYVDPKSDGVLKVFLQLCSDIAYAAHTMFRGFCVRISPKIIDKKNNIKTKEDIEREFVAKYCYKTCEIGLGKPIHDIEIRLKFKEDLIEILKNRYINLYINNKKKYKEKIENDLEYIHEKINSIANKYNIDILNNDYPFQIQITSPYKGYEKILNNDMLFMCKSIKNYDISIKKNILLMQFDLSLQIYLLSNLTLLKNINDLIKYREEKKNKKIPKLNNENLTIKYNKKGYNFIIAFDLIKKIFYINFEDILMLDWDKKDGFNKNIVIKLIEQYNKNNEENIKKGKGIQGTSLTFRLYETDNGIHAYCTSHFFKKGRSKTNSIMNALCNDVWYTAFSSFRGFSIRLSPKISEFKSEDGNYIPMKEQFIFKPIYDEYGDIFKIGKGKENEIILFLLDYITNIKNFILTNIVDKNYEKIINKNLDSILNIYISNLTNIRRLEPNEEIREIKIIHNNKEIKLHKLYYDNTEIEVYNDKGEIEENISITKKIKDNINNIKDLEIILLKIRDYSIYEYNRLKEKNKPKNIEEWEKMSEKNIIY